MKTLFNVEKMMCGGCSSNVEKVLGEVSSIESVVVDLEAKTVSVEGDIDANTIATMITEAGYPATPA
jgi:copper chaperone CopZ